MSNLNFMKLNRENNYSLSPEVRIKNYNEFHIELDDSLRINQASRCMNCGVPFCQFGSEIGNKTIGCPLNNYIPEWNNLISENKFEAAYERLTLTSPFPEFTSRVCPALCEVGCVCNINDSPVTIRDNEYSIIEKAFSNGLVVPRIIEHNKNQKIAIIGSGPAGLSAANELNLMGYDVTIFEKNDRFGGLLMYGIPNMKLEKNIVTRRLDLLSKEGIKFFSNFDATKNVSMLENDFDAILLATGASDPRKINNLEVDNKFIYYAVDFLTLVTKNILNNIDNKICENKRIIVVRGGDTGNDCVGTCIRQNALSIIQFEQNVKPPKNRTNEWPLWPNDLKVDYGAEEYIYLTGCDQREFGRTIKSVKRVNNELVVLTTKVKKINNKVIEIDNSNQEVIVDIIILAMGFSGTKEDIFSSFNLEPTNKNNIKELNYQTNKKNIFTCGDARIGQSLVVKAIKDGIDAAKSINNYLENK